MFKFIYRTVKYALVAALGAATAAKFVLQSRADPETQEIDLVSIFDGTNLASVANPFYGGKILNLFAGTNLDLRKVKPGPTGVSLDLAVLCGGVNILVPEGWRVRSQMNINAGGFNDATRTNADPDATTVTLTGFVVLGGVNIQSRPLMEVVS